MRRAAAFLAIVAVASCRHRTDHAVAAPRACEATGQRGLVEMDPRQLGGGYDITFVATAGPQSGQRVSGRLVLRPQQESLIPIAHPDTSVAFTQPVIGSLDAAVEAIGATRMGDLTSTDPTAPGVGVYVTTRRNGGVTGMLARLGSMSNVHGQLVFDGGYFTMFVARVGPNGIWGGWVSSPGTGGLVTPEARGHFCAAKMAG